MRGSRVEEGNHDKTIRLALPIAILSMAVAYRFRGRTRRRKPWG